MSESGCLYVVATPIGHLGDISSRAVEVLKSVAVICAEDTRHSGRLLAHFDIRTPQVSLHEHNEEERSEQIIARLLSGDDVALISDAGTPLISDPGYTLISKIRQHKLRVSPVPGPSAVVAALSVAGLPTDRFVFEGFLPARSVARAQRLEALSKEPRTMVLYLSRHQAGQQIEDLCEVFGNDRQATLAREMTKLHETLRFGTLEELLVAWQDHPQQQKGELVLVVAGAPKTTVSDDEITRLLAILLDEMGAKQAAAMAVKITGCAKNHAYRTALDILSARQT